MISEIDEQIPRQVRLTGLGRFVTAVAFLLAAGVVPLTAFLWNEAAGGAVRSRRRAQEGLRTEARVVETRRIRGDNPRVEVRYSYFSGGMERSGRIRLGQRAGARYVPGYLFDVMYLPSEPAQSWLPGHEPERVPFFVVPLVVMSFAAAIVPITVALKHQRRLLAEGRAAEGVVVDSKRFRNSNHRTTWRVKYRFRILSGAERFGKCDLGHQTPAGTPLTVLYDRDDPGRNAVFPLSLVKPAAVRRSFTAVTRSAGRMPSRR